MQKKFFHSHLFMIGVKSSIVCLLVRRPCTAHYDGKKVTGIAQKLVRFFSIEKFNIRSSGGSRWMEGVESRYRINLISEHEQKLALPRAKNILH